MDSLSTGSSDLILQSATDPSNQEILTISSNSHVLTGQRLSDGKVMSVMATIVREAQGPRIVCETPGLIVNKKPTSSTILNQGDFIQVGYSTYHVIETGSVATPQQSATTQVNENLTAVETNLQAANENFNSVAPVVHEPAQLHTPESFAESTEHPVESQTPESSEVAQFFAQSYAKDSEESVANDSQFEEAATSNHQEFEPQQQFEAVDAADPFETADAFDSADAFDAVPAEPQVDVMQTPKEEVQPEPVQHLAAEPTPTPDQNLPSADGESPEKSLERLLAALNSVDGPEAEQPAVPETQSFENQSFETPASETQQVSEFSQEAPGTGFQAAPFEEGLENEFAQQEPINQFENNSFVEQEAAEPFEQAVEPVQSFPETEAEPQSSFENVVDEPNEVSLETMQLLEQAISNVATQIEESQEATGFEDSGVDQQVESFAATQPAEVTRAFEETQSDFEPAFTEQQNVEADYAHETPAEFQVEQQSAPTGNFPSDSTTDTGETSEVDDAVSEWREALKGDAEEFNDGMNFSSVFGQKSTSTQVLTPEQVESTESESMPVANDPEESFLENSLVENGHFESALHDPAVENVPVEPAPVANDFEESFAAENLQMEPLPEENSLADSFAMEQMPAEANIEPAVQEQHADQPEAAVEAQEVEEDNSVAAVLARMNLAPEFEDTTQEIDSVATQMQEAENAYQEIHESDELTDEELAAADPGEDSDDVQSYMNSLLQRLNSDEGDSQPEGQKKESVSKKKQTVVETEQEEAQAPVTPLRPDEFVPKRVAPEVNSNMAAMRELANAATKNALSTSMHRKTKLTRTWYLTAALCGFLGAIFFGLLSHSLGDIFSILCAASGVIGLGTGAVFVYSQMQPSSTAK